MHNNFGYKLIAVLDVNTLKLFKAEGLKITDEIGNFTLHDEENIIHEKRENLKGAKSGLSPRDLHTSTKDLDFTDSSKAALLHINHLVSNDASYKEIYIVASSKFLGHIRQLINGNLKKLLTKEINKDLVHHNTKEIEKAIFA